jgi:hypothetical protein
VKTSEETKYAPSVVAETLRSLSEQARVCHEKIDLIEAAQSVNRGEVLAEVGKLLDACQNLRDAILSEDSTATWHSKSDLNTLIVRLQDAAVRRRRYLELAQVLGAGAISHRRERTRQERLALRDAAVAELMEISERAAPPELPGPEAENWLEWACSLEDDANDPELLQLKNGFPRLDDFVRQLEFDWWRNGSKSASENAKSRVREFAPAPRHDSNGTHLNGIGSATQREPAVEEPETISVPAPVEAAPSRAEIESPETEAQQVAVSTSFDEVQEAPVAEPLEALAATEEQEEALSPETLSPSRNGRLSFIPWDEVDQFSKHIERAKIERKDARTVRALLAISQWLDPKEHNPLTHPKCGIRALTDHPGSADFEWVSPNDVMQAISLDDGLPLLTGGADLLRWGLLQPSERNFQGIASVRRFSKEHLKAWFSDLYRIALSDKQIDDIFHLTSGIPVLIAELHKLIIAVPEDPPTWLGLARWIEIKAQFEKHIPTIAHELKKGTPAVRLTDRELSLLNMVVTVSADSTEDTILANLSDHWERYQHPEYRPFSSRDEVSLAVLLDLGLLPRRNVTGVLPSRALVPVKQDDAICKLVQHL